MSERVSESSGRINDGETFFWSGRIILVSCTIRTDESTDVTVTLYNGQGDSKQEKWSFKVTAAQGNSGRNFRNLLFPDGLTCVVDGSNGYCYLEKII